MTAFARNHRNRLICRIVDIQKDLLKNGVVILMLQAYDSGNFMVRGSSFFGDTLSIVPNQLLGMFNDVLRGTIIDT